MAKKKLPQKKSESNEGNQSEKKKKEESVAKILRSFKSNLHSIKFFFNKFGGIAENEDESALKSAQEFTKTIMQDLGISIDEKEKGETKKNNDKPKITEEKLLEITRKLKKQPKLTSQNFQILSSSSFLMLNNYFEYLIADLLTYHYTKFKDTLNLKEFKMSLKEVNEYETIEELEKHLIYKEVETMLIEMSFDSLIKHFKTKFNISSSDEIVNWDIINECRERRHLIVHNASIVNKKYLSRTNNPENKKVGDKLSINKEYFQKVFLEIKLAGLLLSYDCWGSWDGENATKAIQDMLVESFDSLNENNIDFCYRITSYIQKIEARDEDQEDILLRAKFNMCIALKKQKKTPELNKILKTIKVGTSTPFFKLAHAILSDKVDKTILDLLEQSFKLKQVTIETYSEWPIFEFIRNKKILNTKIEKILNN
jgi:hypothetical protein|tara:strand:+ start:50 stop:1330 length:1281 start_codon:yes stop_codon:yes gene_type:complete